VTTLICGLPAKELSSDSGIERVGLILLRGCEEWMRQKKHCKWDSFIPLVLQVVSKICDNKVNKGSFCYAVFFTLLQLRFFFYVLF
jgi:hypothetical protein